jgi:hypothetical protein
MFVRLRKKPLNIVNDICLEFVLLKNYWSRGKVKHEFVKYLSSIRMGHIWVHWRRRIFWQKVEKALDSLGLPSEARKSIEQKIITYVPLPEEVKSQDESVVRKRLKTLVGRTGRVKDKSRPINKSEMEEVSL